MTTPSEMKPPEFNVRRTRGLPAYFRANVNTARGGGSTSYWTAGWHLGLHRVDEYSYELEESGEDQAEEELDEVAALASWDRPQGDRDHWNGPIPTVEHEDRAVVWLGRWLPDFLDAVPKRRRRTFALGFMAAVANRG